MRARRHALVIGIDTYPGFGLETQLAGAVRDAQTMAEVLVGRHGFAPEDVHQCLETLATRQGILDALANLRSRAESGDQVLLYFSGHGSQMTDREGDEGDGLDETLVPVDSGRDDDENRDITDDEINHWAAELMEVTPHLTMIFDCCHAATLQRPFWRVRSVPPDLRPVDALPPSPLPVWRDVETGPRPLILAACRDDERALELPPWIAGEYRGAFSFHLIEALRHVESSMTWREIFDRAASALAADCPEQHPEASGDGLDASIFGDSGANSEPGQRAADAGERLLALADRPNRFGLSMKLFRSRGGAWRHPADSTFVEGDRLRTDLRHGHDRGLFVYLFDVSPAGKVTLLFPDLDGHEVLDPGRVLTVGARQGDSLTMTLPGDSSVEKAADHGDLILIGSSTRLSTTRWLAEAAPIAETGAAGVRAKYRVRHPESPTSGSIRVRRTTMGR